ncbi:MAG: ribosome maturation factor RimM [Oscillospiraceae bacterium]|jgi:16S rRNA processing protein RimM|nr:ribosome maturation factor RimM [Oscillospiraceae bacterium]
MDKQFLEAGVIVGTHGVRGEVRLNPWCDDVAFLSGLKTLHIAGRAYALLSARPHKHLALLRFEGVDDVTAAQALRGQVVYADRAEAALPEGRFFIRDLIGLSVVDCASKQPVGTLTDVWQQPAHDVYVVRDAEGREHLIPNVPAFVQEIDWPGRTIRVTLIEGM